MRRLLVVGLLVCRSVGAQDFGQETRVLAYWEKPFGGYLAKGTDASFGFKLTTGTTGSGASPPKATTVDVRFDGQGFRSFGLNGVVLRQNQESGGGGPPAEINWWIVGGIAIGAGVVAYQENRKAREARSQQRRCVTVADPREPGGFVTVCR
jgi:hypothetical protein